MSNHTIQVSSQHYNNDYDDLHRFISYYYQIDVVRNLNPNNILEVGVGNKTVSDYLRKLGYAVDTCDFDVSLNPDYVADVCNLPFPDNTYDVVMICQVLEHIPFEDLEVALRQLARVSSKYVIISLPYSSFNFEFIIRFPWLQKIIRRFYWSKLFRIPRFYKQHQFDGQHYWELGKRGFPVSKIRLILQDIFLIESEFSPVLNPYHHFFVLKKLLK